MAYHYCTPHIRPNHPSHMTRLVLSTSDCLTPFFTLYDPLILCFRNSFLDPVMPCPGSSGDVELCCPIAESTESGLPNPNFILKTGSSITCSGCYYLKQNDVDTGYVIGTAEVSAVLTVVTGEVLLTD